MWSGQWEMLLIYIPKFVKSSHIVKHIQYRETPQIQLSHHNHFLETRARRERLMVWKICGEGGVFFTILPLSLTSFQPPSFLNSWKVWDTLLELIRVEWGKRWGETAEITSLRSLPVLCALFHLASVHMFSDSGSGIKVEGDDGVWGGHLSWSHRAATTFFTFFTIPKWKRWWNDSLIQ